MDVCSCLSLTHLQLGNLGQESLGEFAKHSKPLKHINAGEYNFRPTLLPPFTWLEAFQVSYRRPLPKRGFSDHPLLHWAPPSLPHFICNHSTLLFFYCYPKL